MNQKCPRCKNYGFELKFARPYRIKGGYWVYHCVKCNYHLVDCLQHGQIPLLLLIDKDLELYKEIMIQEGI